MNVIRREMQHLLPYSSPAAGHPTTSLVLMARRNENLVSHTPSVHQLQYQQLVRHCKLLKAGNKGNWKVVTFFATAGS